MRLNRPLTSSDQWDIITLLAILTIAFASLATIWQTGLTSHLSAFAVTSGTTPTANATKGSQTSSATDPLLSAVQRPTLLTPNPSATSVSLSPNTTITAKPRPAVKKPVPEIKWYNGQKYQYSRTIRMRVTAYSPDGRSCWPYPGTTTASGLSVKTNRGKLVAADTDLLPFHSLVSIPGYHNGEAVPVLDRGGAIKGRRVDVLQPTFAKAQVWGNQMLNVKIYVPIKN